MLLLLTYLAMVECCCVERSVVGSDAVYLLAQDALTQVTVCNNNSSASATTTGVKDTTTTTTSIKDTTITDTLILGLTTATTATTTTTTTTATTTTTIDIASIWGVQTTVDLKSVTMRNAFILAGIRCHCLN